MSAFFFSSATLRDFQSHKVEERLAKSQGIFAKSPKSRRSKTRLQVDLYADAQPDCSKTLNIQTVGAGEVQPAWHDVTPTP